jgi:hypothetical protein
MVGQRLRVPAVVRVDQRRSEPAVGHGRQRRIAGRDRPAVEGPRPARTHVAFTAGGKPVFLDPAPPRPGATPGGADDPARGYSPRPCAGGAWFHPTPEMAERCVAGNERRPAQGRRHSGRDGDRGRTRTPRGAGRGHQREHRQIPGRPRRASDLAGTGARGGDQPIAAAPWDMSRDSAKVRAL